MRFNLLNSWAIDKNELHISLINYYIEIHIYSEDDRIAYMMRVVSNNQKELFFDFNTLEEAITFTEDVINKDYFVTLDDIMNAYEEECSTTKVMKKTRDK